MSTAIAVFAKTPGLSQVKTRLAKDIGKDTAEIFYEMSVKATEEVLLELKMKSQSSVELYWALAEENGLNHPMWNKFKTIWTGEGDLGKRLFNISDKLLKKHNKVILIGTDSPQIEYELILKTIDKLNENPKNCVVGPAYDGGFYLFGCSYLITENIWTSVSYSREDTLEQLLQKLKNENIYYDFLNKMSDVDKIDDFEALYQYLLLTKGRHLPERAKLFEWLELSKYKSN
ncbi:hypothetical protein DUF2064 [Gottschalkia acidurici 9a]|uniref:Glycosyltransferase n=1 Tax=Gottschalkia acidurici (strain ATCC 7906 / DSM 604 / BCRC 14475 / CIP 104303 / KCTC 5404 / NCIMB 10678 / 9a) TaxID=1128398 RepID=K0B0S6_GOTA9|nr:TIGR04282 family arsenosugar biosynthesis glycosyltransferase [Gottschalkia acidurici]AFS79628.1 hypothetical protein DUF2064 [Gottschalkia acidurici 9a]